MIGRAAVKAARSLSSTAAKESGSSVVNYVILAGIGGAGMLGGIQVSKMTGEEKSHVFNNDEITSYMW
eukprot:CAMPEP_0173434546 /NCGR_PEP_ID=MMETSP1357-20121228/13110_1 /TAXON_ID=77926 /ORGANISM="Hemiselmis rufescens, Strain PCC563" /LENGTH=67 /DNA_ID=CAMNT_0014399423 /DNA_START=147 /DNA_END=350 /DNA_ORIENTATION=+